MNIELDSEEHQKALEDSWNKWQNKDLAAETNKDFWNGFADFFIVELNKKAVQEGKEIHPKTPYTEGDHYSSLAEILRRSFTIKNEQNKNNRPKL